MPVLRRIIGVLLITAAVGGLLFSVFAMISIWRALPSMTANLQNTVTLFYNTLETTSQGLVVTRQALRSSVDTIANLQSTLETTSETLESTDPMVSDLIRLMEAELPTTIEATQQSIDTAQQSAQVIDTLLSSLSRIPLIGDSIGYNPDVPLSAALGQVGDSLETLPETFAGMEDNLRTTQGNLQTFRADISVMTASIEQIHENVAQYEQVVDDYAASIDQVQMQLQTLSARIPQISRTLAWALTFFLVWMLVAQLGLFTQGWELLTESVRREVVEEIIEETGPQVVVVRDDDDDDDDDRD